MEFEVEELLAQGFFVEAGGVEAVDDFGCFGGEDEAGIPPWQGGVAGGAKAVAGLGGEV